MAPYYPRAILYFDGASRHNPHGPAGCACVIVEMDDCGADGETIVEGYEYLGYDYSNNEAEYLGLIEGLRIVTEDISVGTLYIRGDSEVVIRQLEGDYEVRSNRIRPHYNEAYELLNQLSCDYRFKWIPRSKNYRADQLANFAIDNEDTDTTFW